MRATPVVDRNVYTGTSLTITGIHAGPRSGGMICEHLRATFVAFASSSSSIGFPAARVQLLFGEL
jgi:hypothetical protein